MTDDTPDLQRIVEEMAPQDRAEIALEYRRAYWGMTGEWLSDDELADALRNDSEDA